MTKKSFLQGVYDKGTALDIGAYYAAWADSYDDELAENGYATPGRCAAALAATGTPLGARILDFGCGTGISGSAFAEAGYTTLDGMDLSPEMLAVAQTKGVYRSLQEIDASVEIPRGYDVIAAVGVISPGAAPPETLAKAVAALEPGGRVVMSYNDHALADPAFPAALEAVKAEGMTLLFEEHGPHVPGIGLGSTVYVLER